FKMAAPQAQPIGRLCVLLKERGLSGLIRGHTNNHMTISRSMQAAWHASPVQTFFSGQHNGVASYNPPEIPFTETAGRLGLFAREGERPQSPGSQQGRLGWNSNGS
ncbi:MAG: hypothetical protein COB66_08005, partial [Coxiella sp. (in: Bacteria)]